MAKRHFLMLAHKYRGDEPIGSWFCSEKLDGVRAFWDGGFTRGRLCRDVDFANTEKDSRYVTPQRATGLWSRYGKAIQAPGWWLDRLPVGVPLDGELFSGRSEFQSLVSVVKRLSGGPEWVPVQFCVFDSPPYPVLFANGEINETNFRKRLVGIRYPGPGPGEDPAGRRDFASVHARLLDSGIENATVRIHPQHRLGHRTPAAREELAERLEAVVSGAGEGLILRSPSSMWVPQRSRTLLKVKACQDSEGTVVGYTFGRETDKGSKLLGLMGAMVLSWEGRIFELSGFTDEERRLSAGAAEYGVEHPGERVPAEFSNPAFPIGSRVTFSYRERTRDGMPKEARYMRQREDL